MTNARHGDLPAATAQLDRWDVAAAGLVDAWSAEIARGGTIIAIKDAPDLRQDIVACVDLHRASPNDACASPIADAIGPRDPLVEAATMAGIAVVDLTDVYCDSSRCVPVIGNVMAYRNHDHLTGTFARTLTNVLGSRLADALDDAGHVVGDVPPTTAGG